MTPATVTEAVAHAMNCLHKATPGLPITTERTNTGHRNASQWFTLGPINDCHTHATETAPGELHLFVEIGLVTSIQVSLTLNEERDTAILRHALNFYATHYGIEGHQRPAPALPAEYAIEHQHIPGGQWHQVTGWSHEPPLNDGHTLAPDERIVRRHDTDKEAPMPPTNNQPEAPTNDRRNLPPHRTEAEYPECATCDGGGCPDCTDPA